MAKKVNETPSHVCGDCIHRWACKAQGAGENAFTDATNCALWELHGEVYDTLGKQRLIDANGLMSLAQNHTDRKVDCNDIARFPTAKIDSDTSDGYHTFNELYHHRAVLFSVIVRNYPELCWKSKQHHDGSMYPGMFIIGIDTPDGQASYHYDVAPYWDMFDCKELVCAPVWDGHTPSEAIERIGKLGEEGVANENS